ncbi:BRCA1-associated ATM activator 1 isoform X2 [Triplophysa rosa]|uniref:BRCA1-associated ATM activator 1 n=1 Tax=Triplophysa rosa TaxID=992332 RepID=A0A9W7WZ84_TRIRA|nr:BRCA1-associated ATM activator 1 isoform X2 [Triplophysa rosa]KAI7811103.1 putative BRCA1-associated ATM activator 1 [Triplophysa rosa]
MDSECLSFLPRICVALADPRQSPPDDTSLEKLLDWFKDLPNQRNVNGEGLLQQQPCLLEFISSVCKCKDTDHAILSFTLKLTGLLAATEQGFSLLEEEGLLACAFKRGGWCAPDLWHEPSVRSGWLQGLLHTLNHRKALEFVRENGLIKVLLHLQNDPSLFVSSLANEVLVNILNFMTSSKMSNSSDAVGSAQCPLGPDWVSVSSEIIRAGVEALGSKKHPQVIQGLKLLSLVLSQCGEPIRSMLWKDVLVPLEVLINGGSGLLTLPLMTVLQAAVRTPLLSQSDCKVKELMEAMLGAGNGKDCFQCAALIVTLEKCPEELKRKAINIILLPLRCLSTQLQDIEKELEIVVKKQLSQKSSCISLLLQSLSGITELAHTKYPFEDIPQVTCSVMLLLRICSGHRPSFSLPSIVSTQLIGCCKVQRCGLDTLDALSVYNENLDLRHEVFGVLLEYLQNPDSHATVLKKALQAAVRWVGVCSPFPDLLQFISRDLFPALEKRTCDLRWEVRDSTLEFITQMTAALRGNTGYAEVLHTSSMFSILLSSLADVEGYVRASAVGAVGEAVTSLVQQTELLPEEVLTQMMAILSQDTEGFPRRAVVKAFTSWLKGTHPLPALDQSLSAVLSLGGNDLDWEVKIHTLELADVLMERTLTYCPYATQISSSPDETRLTQALRKLKDLGLLDLLLNSLFDCDRPVCEKACSLLLKLRTLAVDIDRSDVVLDVCGNRWGDEVGSRYLNKPQAERSLCVINGAKESCEKMDSDLLSIREISLPDVVRLLDLDSMQRTLILSRDHVVNSPRSLMEDILLSVQQTEENIVDCY